MTSQQSSDAEQRPYDDEIYVKAVRYIGQLEALGVLTEKVACMPSDAATARLIGSLRFVAQQAIISAWEYATRYAPPKDVT